MSRVRRPDDGPLRARCLSAPSLATRPPAASRAARRGVATGRRTADTLKIGVFYVKARALTFSEEAAAAEVFEAMVFEALFQRFPQHSLWSFPTRDDV